jgi:asparaginyl-tRNA synthetase
MKELFVSDLLARNPGESVTLQGWLARRRHQGKILFMDIADSTGAMQAVVEQTAVGDEAFECALKVPLESGVGVSGLLSNGANRPNEIHVKTFDVLGEAGLQLTPHPRSNFDIFDPKHASQLLDYRHIYLRNPKVMAILQFRAELMRIVREWFYKNRFMEFDAPILTPTPLYDGKTAMGINVHGEDLFLSQCAGFYLEAAAHAFERIFNMGPSFRGEESRSKRHLMEYWHIKAEVAFGDREDIIRLVEDILGYVTRECQTRCREQLKVLGTELCADSLKAPFPRITYEDAVAHLKGKGFDAEFGQALSTAEEEELSKLFNSPFWIVGIPRAVEPFPYVIDPSDPRITMVADLIASNGCGELLGIAEKIHDPAMLDERLAEKGKLDEPRYQFVRDVHQAGCVPHIAFGMGLERLIRWLLNIPHVRDAIPFPRVVRRSIYP